MKNFSGTSLLVTAVLTAGFTTTAMAQVNDECSGAVTLVSGIGTAFDTTAATTSPQPVSDATCASTFLGWGTANKDVWFRWTAPSGGKITVSTCSTGSFDTSMVIYSGTDCTALTQVACNGDGTGQTGCQQFYSRIADFSVTSGTTYFIRVGGYDDPDATIPAESGVGQVTLTFQNIASGCPGTGGCGTAQTTPGCSDANCCTLVCDIDPACCDTAWDANCVGTAATIPSCGVFLYSCVAPAYPNDCAPNATVVNSDSSVAFNNTNANNDGPDHDGTLCSSGSDGFPNDLWYRVPVFANGFLRITTCNGNGTPTVDFDTKLAVYDMGTNPSAFSYNTLTAAGVLIGCNDDGAGTCGAAPIYASDLSVTVAAGRTYLVRVSGYRDETTGVETSGSGTVQFDVPETCVLPANTATEAEACGTSGNNGCNVAGAPTESITLGSTVRGTVFTTTVGTAETRDVDFYSFTLTAPTTVTARAFGGSLLNLTITRGDLNVANCAGLQTLAIGSGSCPNTVSICLNAGTYYVVVSPTVFTGIPCGTGPLTDYVLELTGTASANICPDIIDTACSAPGPDTTTTSIPQAPTGNFLQACATACANNSGGSADVLFAASFSGANLVKELTCANFGAAALRSQTPTGGTCGFVTSDRLTPAKFKVYRDTDGGAPTNPAELVTGGDLVLIAERDILFAGGVFMGNIEFDPPICLENETTVVLVLETYNLFNGTNLPAGIPAGAGYRSGIGVGLVTGAPSNLWTRATLCGGTQFGAAGAGSYQWPIQMNGQLAQCGSGSNCPADYDDSGTVDSSDLGTLLSAWGTAAGDLDGDGDTNSGDLGILLSAWGPCAP
jgi:hypothetical protein